MATKNLSRTIIEPGRLRSTRQDNKRFTKRERVCNKLLLKRCAADVELYDAAVFEARKPAYLEQPDKLGPVYSWITSHVGSPWDDVYSELRSKFDTRTVTGNHIINDHLLPSIDYRNEPRVRWRSWYRWWVDDDGILRGSRHRSRPRETFREGYLTRSQEERLIEKADRILRDRRVSYRGDQLFWFDPTGPAEWTPCSAMNFKPERNKRRPTCWREHRWMHPERKTGSELDSPVWCCYQSPRWGYRQGKPLTRDEIERWNKVSIHVKERYVHLEEDKVRIRASHSGAVTRSRG